MKRWLIAGLLIVVFAGSVQAANLLHVRDHSLRSPWPFEMWGCRQASWMALPTAEDELRPVLQPLAEHGVNTVVFALDALELEEGFFAADGSVRDAAVGERFTRLTAAIRNHYMGAVVVLFSAQPRHWLESPDAYRDAARNVARLLPAKHSTVFVVGDLLWLAPWPDGAPVSLDDPDVALDVCGAIKEAREDTLIAVPARSVAGGPGEHVLYVGKTAQALAACVRAVREGRDPAKASPDAAVVPADQVLLPRAMHDQLPAANARFAEEVERRRLERDMPPSPTGGGTAEPACTPQEREQGFTSLFDGRSLDGWTTLVSDWGAWTVEDGAIHCRGISGPWLRTRRRFGDFIVCLEFRIEKNGNSGIFLRAPLDGRSSRFGMEMQIRGKHDDTTTGDTTGAIYDALPPRIDAGRPAGEWNEVEITCQGPRITIRLNGQLVQDFQMTEVPKLAGRLRRGVIGLQDHNDKVWFRRIRIKPLEKSEGRSEK